MVLACYFEGLFNRAKIEGCPQGNLRGGSFAANDLKYLGREDSCKFGRSHFRQDSDVVLVAIRRLILGAIFLGYFWWDVRAH